MTDPIQPEVVPRSRSKPFDDAIRQKAFLLWALEADSDIPKTARLLVESELAEAAADEREPRKMPDTDTLRLWVVKEDWPAKRHDMLVRDGTAGALYSYAMGKLILRLDKMTTKHGEIIDMPVSEPVLDRDGNYVGEKPSSAVGTILKAIDLGYQATRLVGRNDGDAEPKLKPRRLPGHVAGQPRETKAIADAQLQRIREAKKATKGKS